VDGLDLAVPAGGVHGFLGPNGSGKTTTIRLLLGLAAATSGEMTLFGERVPGGLPRVINRIEQTVRWLASNHVAAFVDGRLKVTYYPDGGRPEVIRFHLQESAIYLGAVMAVVLLVSYLVFPPTRHHVGHPTGR